MFRPVKRVLMAQITKNSLTVNSFLELFGKFWGNLRTFLEDNLATLTIVSVFFSVRRRKKSV